MSLTMLGLYKEAGAAKKVFDNYTGKNVERAKSIVNVKNKQMPEDMRKLQEKANLRYVKEEEERTKRTKRNVHIGAGVTAGVVGAASMYKKKESTEKEASLTLSGLYKVAEKKKVFLGGTTNDSQWRSELIPMLNIDYFDPVVDDWTEEHQEEEVRQRKACDFCLYVITPKMAGVYSIAEAVQDSNERPDKTVFCILEEDDGQTFSEAQLKSLQQTAKIVRENGAACFTSLREAADFMNNGA